MAKRQSTANKPAVTDTKSEENVATMNDETVEDNGAPRVTTEETLPMEPVEKRSSKEVDPSPVFVKGVETYMAEMSLSKPMGPEPGMKHQRMFRNVIISGIMDKDEAVAVANIRYILKVMHEDKTKLFGLKALYRYFEQMKWSSLDERREIEALLELFEATRNPNTRGVQMKRLDLATTSKYIAPIRNDIVMRRLRLAYNVS